MSFFKKPFGALLLCVVLVFCSTAVSVKVKLQNRCDEVVDAFYTGVKSSRDSTLPSLYDQLRELTAIADEICIIADNYGIDTEDVKDYSNWLALALTYSEEDVSYIYSEYSALWKSLKTVEDKLNHTGLSDRHITAMEDYSSRLADVDYNIANAGYNDQVRLFLQKNNRFPTSAFAEMFGVDMPDYFA